MSVLNQTVVEETSKQLKRIKIGYILTITVTSLLLIPVLNILLGRMLFTAIVLGLAIFIKQEVKKHYKDTLLTVALYLSGLAFVMDIIENKMMILQKGAENSTLLSLIVGMSLLTYAVVITILILVSISASRFFEQNRQFNAMTKYQKQISYGPTPFKLNAVSVEPSTMYENRNGTKSQLTSFIVRALVVITLYLTIMNIDVIAFIVLVPLFSLLRMIRPNINMDDSQFNLLVHVWVNFYLQCLFVLTFVLIFLKEIRLGLKRLFNSHKFAFIFTGYGVEITLSALTIMLLGLFNITIPQSQNQDFVEAMQKMLPFVSAIGTVLLAPITEELVFRQGLAELLYRIFDSFTKTPKKIVQDIAVVTAVLVSGVLFGFIHVMSHGDYIAMVPYVVSGIVYTTVYFWSGRNVTVTICIHILHNGIATLITM